MSSPISFDYEELHSQIFLRVLSSCSASTGLSAVHCHSCLSPCIVLTESCPSNSSRHVSAFSHHTTLSFATGRPLSRHPPKFCFLSCSCPLFCGPSVSTGDSWTLADTKISICLSPGWGRVLEPQSFTLMVLWASQSATCSPLHRPSHLVKRLP